MAASCKVQNHRRSRNYLQNGKAGARRAWPCDETRSVYWPANADKAGAMNEQDIEIASLKSQVVRLKCEIEFLKLDLEKERQKAGKRGRDLMKLKRSKSK